MIDNAPGERIDLGHRPPNAHVVRDFDRLEEAGHPAPKMQTAPVQAPKEAVPPPSRPSGKSDSTSTAKPSDPPPLPSDE
jgi:hypothetical protein